MSLREVRVEELLSRRVVDVEGRAVGRIEELHAVPAEGEVVVSEFELGPEAVFERLAVWMGRVPFLRHLAADRRHRVHWELMDLDDPKHPKLRCRREDLPKR